MASFSTALAWRRGGLAAAAGTVALALAAVAVFLEDRSSSAADAPLVTVTHPAALGLMARRSCLLAEPRL
jgi:hypothetical protein